MNKGGVCGVSVEVSGPCGGADAALCILIVSPVMHLYVAPYNNVNNVQI